MIRTFIRPTVKKRGKKMSGGLLRGGEYKGKGKGKVLIYLIICQIKNETFVTKVAHYSIRVNILNMSYSYVINLKYTIKLITGIADFVVGEFC